jgi:uncharacterized BrkB/YihY/UPF0761 family membrane protein
VDTANSPDAPPPEPAPQYETGETGLGEAASGDAVPGAVGIVARWKQRSSAAQEELTGRLDAARRQSKAIDATATVVMRPRYASDALVAGYLAMRVFVLLFPLAYVFVATVGLSARHSSDTTSEAVGHTGLAGAVANSVAQAASGSQRNQIIALVVGLMATAWAGRGALHAARFAHTIPWRLPNPKTSVASAGGLLAGVVVIFIAWFGNWTSRLRHHGWPVVVVVALTVAVVGAVWWLVSCRLPHRGDRWDVLPGAVLVGVGSAALHAAVTLYFAPKLSRSSETYGVLGTGVVILAYLVVVAWLVVLAAELSAGIYAVRHPDDRDEAPHPFA